VFYVSSATAIRKTGSFKKEDGKSSKGTAASDGTVFHGFVAKDITFHRNSLQSHEM
jgi:hypothetical protein